MNENKSVFATLNAINCNEHTEKKNGLTYLSWAWAWAEVKKAYPQAQYTIYENADGMCYHTDGRTCWVKTGVTIDGIEHIEYLPVMNNINKSIPVEQVTSFDVNKAIQRSLTKACARHGLGLYIYAGEDLPEDAVLDGSEIKAASAATVHKTQPVPAAAVQTDKPKDIARKFVEGNAKAAQYYMNQYCVGTLDEINSRQWVDIYNDLRKRGNVA